MTEVKLHPDVIAWNKWSESDEGVDCLAGSATGQYLKNRLWRAFMTGCFMGRSHGRGMESFEEKDVETPSQSYSALHRASHREDARQWLASKLLDGLSHPVQEILRDGNEGFGFRQILLRELAREMDVRTFKAGCRWFWECPPPNAPNAPKADLS